MIPLSHVIEVASLILVAYLLGCSIGYGGRRLARAMTRRSLAAPEVLPLAAADIVPRSPARRLAQVAEEAAPVAPVSRSPNAQRPPQLPAPRIGGADDLRKIKGIGHKTESALHDLGVYHFDQIAAWQPLHVAWLEGRIAIKGRIGREQWIEQATLLATAPRSNAA